MLVAEKQGSYRYNAENGRSASMVFFVMTGCSCRRDSQNEAISVDERFSSSLLSVHISVSSSSANSSILLTGTHLTPADLSPSPRRTHQCLYSAVKEFVESNRQDSCPVFNFLSAHQTFQVCSLFLFWFSTLSVFP
jgi:hypothetical protein